MDETPHHLLNSVFDAPTIAERIEFFTINVFTSIINIGNGNQSGIPNNVPTNNYQTITALAS